MSTVIYLANQQIQVITGTPGNRKISVADCYTEDAPDGSIINGMIMDADAFVSFMQNFWTTHNLPTKDVILVINSTKFIGKNIEMPPLNSKKTEEFINRERIISADIFQSGRIRRRRKSMPRSSRPISSKIMWTSLLRSASNSRQYIPVRAV